MTEFETKIFKELLHSAEQTTLYLKIRKYPEPYMERLQDALKEANLILYPTLWDGTPRK